MNRFNNLLIGAFLVLILLDGFVFYIWWTIYIPNNGSSADGAIYASILLAAVASMILIPTSLIFYLTYIVRSRYQKLPLNQLGLFLCPLFLLLGIVLTFWAFSAN
jgi:hypothetical protein